MFLGAGDGEAEFQLSHAPDVDMELRRNLGRHAWGDRAGGVVAGREKIQGEAAFGIGGDGVAPAGGGVDDCDFGAWDAEAVGVHDRATDGAGGRVLGSRVGD